MSGDLSNYLFDFLIHEQTDKKVRQTLIKILVFTRDKTSLPMMSRLAEEKQAGARKLLAEVLAKCGVAAEPALFDFLNDDRWYVARNVIAILGEIRSQASLEYLPSFLQHEDLRVQRETIRTLTKIGGQTAIDILIKAAQSSDQDLCRQALLSLGAMRAESAVPVLRKLLQQSGWNQQTMDLKKDAIRALGEIRCKDALDDLLAIANRKRLLRRRPNEELRIAAIHALGELGERSVHDALEAFTNESSVAVARAAAKALKQVDKG